MASAGPCPLCRQRKAKRACPAKRARICAHCCGTKRRVEIDCPADCVYLTGEHAHGWEGRETERKRDLRRVAPHIQALSEAQARLFFLTLAGLSGIRSRRELDDRLLGQAVAALRKTAETRGRGILYEHPAEDLRAQGLLQELRGLFETREEGRSVAPDDRDLLAVLGALEASLGATLREEAGATAFLDTAVRLLERVGASPEPSQPSSAKPIILEP